MTTTEQTTDLARSIVEYIETGRQWTVDDLAIPGDEYRVEDLESGDLYPVTVENVASVLRSIAR